MAVSFIFFDAGFTLLHPWPSVGHHYAQIAEQYGVKVESITLEAAFRPAWRAALAAQSGASELPYGTNLEEARVFWSRVIRECFRAAEVSPPEHPSYYREVFDRFAEADCWRLYPDVEPALELLKERGVPWGVLSNWDPRLRRILGGMGLLDRAEAVVLSCEARAEKPSPAIFRAAERACGRTSAEIALIGDEAKADGEGAHLAGWRHCLVLRSPKGNEPSNLVWEATLTDCVCAILDR